LRERGVAPIIVPDQDRSVLAGVVVALLALGFLALASLTGVGARERGAGVWLAILEGLVFPLTWAVWYVRDQPLSNP
jgi:hypothetical protein